MVAILTDQERGCERGEQPRAWRSVADAIAEAPAILPRANEVSGPRIPRATRGGDEAFDPHFARERTKRATVAKGGGVAGGRFELRESLVSLGTPSFRSTRRVFGETGSLVASLLARVVSPKIAGGRFELPVCGL